MNMKMNGTGSESLMTRIMSETEICSPPTDTRLNPNGRLNVGLITLR